MTRWQLVFAQSRANAGMYAGDGLPAHHWHWPQDTWLQKRRRYLQASYPHMSRAADLAREGER